MVGVVGAGLSPTAVLLTAIAGALAGAVSMAAGEYMATKSQNQVLHGEIKLERNHINKYNEEELKELSELLDVIGIDQEETELREQITTYYKNHPDNLLKIMIALEFGIVESVFRSPWKAAFYSGMLFTTGALPSVLPFLANDTHTGLAIAAAATTTSLLLVGTVKAWATRGNWITAAIENLVVACFGGSLAYGVGVFFEKILS